MTVEPIQGGMLPESVWAELLAMDADVFCPPRHAEVDDKILDTGRCTECEPALSLWQHRVVLLPGEHTLATIPDEPTRFTSSMLPDGKLVYHTTGARCPYHKAVDETDGGCAIWERRPVLCRTFPLWPFRESYAGAQKPGEDHPSVVTNLRFKIMPICPAFSNHERMRFHVFRWARLWKDIEPLLPGAWWNFLGSWYDDGWISAEKWLRGDFTAPQDPATAKFPQRQPSVAPDIRVVIHCAKPTCRDCNGRGTVRVYNPQIKVHTTRICNCAMQGYESRRQNNDLGSVLFTRFSDWGVKFYEPPVLGVARAAKAAKVAQRAKAKVVKLSKTKRKKLRAKRRNKDKRK